MERGSGRVGCMHCNALELGGVVTREVSNMGDARGNECKEGVMPGGKKVSDMPTWWLLSKHANEGCRWKERGMVGWSAYVQ